MKVTTAQSLDVIGQGDYGRRGRNRATMRAVLPEDDVATIAAAFRSSASRHAARLIPAGIVCSISEASSSSKRPR